MPEEFFEDQQQEKLDWKKYLATARRRCWFYVIPFFVAWAVVWSVSWLLPSVYRSATLILVERPSSQLVVGANVTQDIQSRMDSISQQILSRTNLLRIINNLNLYAEQRNKGRITDDELVERMRKNIEIEIVRSSDRDLSSFNIYFSSPNPDNAQQVTTELTTALITGTLEVTQGDLERQTKFLDDQLAEARNHLTAQEQRVREFKDHHIGELPGQLQSNIQILSGLQTQLQNQLDALGRARQQKEYLESLISQYTTVARTTKSGDSAPVGLPALDQELERLRSQLADLSSHYTDQHPDVRKVREQIARTEKTKQQLIAQLNSKSTDSSAAEVDVSSPGPLMEVRSQLKANQIEIANRQHSSDALQAQIASYQARLNSTPVREQELADLTRDYDQSKTNYDSLLAKKNQSELATALARQQQGDHFRIIDPPSRPTKPFSPNRLKMSFMGLAAGLALGIVVAGGAEFLDDRIYDEEDFKKLVPAEVMVEIPALQTVVEEQDAKRSLWIAGAGVAVIGVIVMLGTAISFLRG